MMFLAGLPLGCSSAALAAVAAAMPIVFSFLLHDYQRERVLIFLDPESDPLGAGYHITQSKIAIGSGGLFGKGFLNGTQSHATSCPSRTPTSSSPTMAEEWGLIGGLFLILAASSCCCAGGCSVALDAQGPVRAARRGRADRDDLLLRRDQPDDGDGPRPGGRHPAAAHLLRRHRR